MNGAQLRKFFKYFPDLETFQSHTISEMPDDSEYYDPVEEAVIKDSGITPDIVWKDICFIGSKDKDNENTSCIWTHGEYYGLSMAGIIEEDEIISAKYFNALKARIGLENDFSFPTTFTYNNIIEAIQYGSGSDYKGGTYISIDSGHVISAYAVSLKYAYDNTYDALASALDVAYELYDVETVLGEIKINHEARIEDLEINKQHVVTFTDNIAYDEEAYTVSSYCPDATKSVTGGIRLGYAQTDKYYPVEVNASQQAYVYVPWVGSEITKATSEKLGGIKIGYAQSGKSYPVELDTDDKAYVSVPWNGSIYTSGTYITVSDNEISATYTTLKDAYKTKVDALATAYDVAYELTSVEKAVGIVLNHLEKTKQHTLNFTDNISWDDETYTVSSYCPVATDSIVGGFKTGYLKPYLNSKSYPIEKNESNQAYVYVPWEGAIYSGSDTIDISDNNVISSKLFTYHDDSPSGNKGQYIESTYSLSLGTNKLYFSDSTYVMSKNEHNINFNGIGDNEVNIHTTGYAYVKGIKSTDTTYSPYSSYYFASDGSIQKLTTNPLVSITWSELKTLKDNHDLIPGQQYRITDYQCTTTQQNTRSAGNQFDVIVTADSTYILNETARAIQHTEDASDYFHNSYLAAWELKYCLDNDTTRFVWADAIHYEIGASTGPVTIDNNITLIQSDSTQYPGFPYKFLTSDADVMLYFSNLNEKHGTLQSQTDFIYEYQNVSQANYTLTNVSAHGKGVIYYMKDEQNNECPYDFKNIQYKRWMITGPKLNTNYEMYDDEGTIKYYKTGDMGDDGGKRKPIEGAIPVTEARAYNPFAMYNGYAWYTETASQDDNYTFDATDYIWCYTFTAEDVWENKSVLRTDASMNNKAHCNVIKLALTKNNFQQQLNNIVLSDANTLSIINVTFDNYCQDIHADKACAGSFGIGCSKIILGASSFFYSYLFKIGKNCTNSTFILHASSIGDVCENCGGILNSTIINAGCNGWHGIYLVNSNIGTGSCGWIADAFSNIICGDLCDNWECGGYCEITCGNNCKNWNIGTPGNIKGFFKKIKLEHDISCINIDCAVSTSSSNVCQLFTIQPGNYGTEESYKTITIPVVNQDYHITIAKENSETILV